jgi:hypothetical protein
MNTFYHYSPSFKPGNEVSSRDPQISIDKWSHLVAVYWKPEIPRGISLSYSESSLPNTKIIWQSA